MKKIIKTRNIFLLTVMTIGALTIIISLATMIYAKPPKFSYGEYVVSPGDTIWSIALQCGIEQDIRETIYNIRKKNGLDTALIYPGQKLLVPVYEEEAK